MELSLSVAFFLGLLSMPHCLGMCGGIMGALTLALPAEIKAHRVRLGYYVVAYNLGRITSYTLAGIVAGTVGAAFIGGLGGAHGHLVLRALASGVIVALGLRLLGWLPKIKVIESLGFAIWRRLRPVADKCLPVNTLSTAFCFGVIWGWLPCGLVYSALLWAMTATTPLTGGLLMLAFGIGTLPAVVAAGVISKMIWSLSQRAAIKHVLATAMIVFGTALFFIPHAPHHDAHHHSHPQ